MACQYYSACEHGADTFTVAMPKLTFGRGCLGELGARAAARGLQRVAVYTDSDLRRGPYVERVLESLRLAGVDAGVFDEVRIEPDDTSIGKGAKFLAQGSFDGVISVGGGSVMDTAKSSMVYALYPAEFTDYFGPPVGAGRPIPGPVLPHIACPTTSGTGSECTSVAVIRITDLNTKFVIGSPYLLPLEALVDPACCDTLPGNVVASTGFDLLCHALECYTARAYTRWDKVAEPGQRGLLQGANPWSDMAARKALEIAGEYLQRGVADATDQEARDHLMWGATLAGMAFGNSGTHLAHAMSYGVTHLMRDITTEGYAVEAPFIPHGISVVVSAPTVFRHTAPGAPRRHLQGAEYLGAEVHTAGPDEAGEVLAGRIIQLMRDTRVPNGLGAIGFTAADSGPLAQSAVRQTRAIANAPRETALADIQNIYAQSMQYW